MVYVIIALLVALMSAYIGYRRGFKAMWPILFNVLVACYIAIMGTRAIAKLAPGIGEYQYYKALLIIVLAAISYVILYIIARFFAKEDYIHELPDLFEDIGGAVLGFFVGLVCTGFVVFSLYSFVAKIKKMPEMVKTNIACPAKTAVDKSCGFVGGVSLQTVKSNMGIKEVTAWILGEGDSYDSELSNDESVEEELTESDIESESSAKLDSIDAADNLQNTEDSNNI